MPTIKETVSELEQWFLQIQGFKSVKDSLRRESFIEEERFESRQRDLEKEIQRCRQEMVSVIEEFDRMPERHYLPYANSLKQFWQDGKLEESVFIMTKYPSDKDAGKPAAELQNVIDLVTEGIKAKGYKPRIATETLLHPWLWGNVELCLVGCKRGVAIVEDKYLPELNPNVAMEWGWMKGMGRDVLFLREENFKHERADWKGLIDFTFNWADPAPGVEAALDQFFGKPK
jgi:hypothetical protein